MNKRSIVMIELALTASLFINSCIKLDVPANQSYVTTQTTMTAANVLTIKMAFELASPLTDKAHGIIAISEGTVDMIPFGDNLLGAAALEITEFTFLPFVFESKKHCKRFWQAIANRVNEKPLEKYGVRVSFEDIAMCEACVLLLQISQ
jgi:TRAP-type C4-dicarboxylate transport system substrate-binding protein